MNIRIPLLSLTALALSACPSPAPPAAGDAPADAFMAALASHCGQAFAGRIVVDEPVAPGPDAFAGKELVMHVRGCDPPASAPRVPFHRSEERRVGKGVVRSC